jgi:hypothetical protein
VDLKEFDEPVRLYEVRWREEASTAYCSDCERLR